MQRSTLSTGKVPFLKSFEELPPSLWQSHPQAAGCSGNEEEREKMQKPARDREETTR